MAIFYTNSSLDSRVIRYFYVFERVERMLLNRIVNTERGMPDKSPE